MKKIVLTSCGIICEDLKQHFYKLLNRDIAEVKVLFVKIASEGELDPDKTWIDEEYQSILNLGIKAKNIIEYNLGMKLKEFDVIYMLGGNTFYLMKKIREHKIDIEIKEAIENGVVYVGSSAGSVIMGKSIETSLPYDENWIKLEDFAGLNYIDGNVIPHSNRKQEYIEKLKQENKDNIITLYDDYGIIIEEDSLYNYNK